MFLTKPIKSEPIHGLGHLSTITYEGGNGMRFETMFVTNAGEFIECWNVKDHRQRMDFEADLRAKSPEEMLAWVKSRLGYA